MHEQKAGRRAPIAPSASLFLLPSAAPTFPPGRDKQKKPQDLLVLRHFLVRWKGLEPPAY